MSQTFFVLGATHHQAPIEVREKLTLPATQLASLHYEFAAIEGLRELTVLSTCNRTEIYGVASAPDVVPRLQSQFCARQSFAEAEFAKYAMQLHGRTAVQHLLEVAAGLDSQLIGETEIFGQVKDAYATAQKLRRTGPVLNRVFQKAFQAAKQVRTQTAITSGQVSVSNVAVELAQSIFGQLASARVLLLGAGEIGEKTARAFQSRGAAALTVASRRLERAMALANELGAFAMPFWLAPVKLVDFDIVVCATSAPGAVITCADVSTALRRRAARPLLFIDLGLPRDVETTVGDLANVYLYNLDDLARIADENRAVRAAEIEKCRLIIDARTDALWAQISPHLNHSESIESDARAPALHPKA
ncbi:MAG: glutamyl-tRNA reductase [Opitutaceae bacterium]|nr:glutamyl-tRNA reductase [Opitutaceae bacterium]